jgi:hypothetical protein
MPGGHGGIHSRLQISQPPQLVDDPLADLPEDLANVGIAGRLDFDKAGLEARFGTIEIDALMVGLSRKTFVCFELSKVQNHPCAATQLLR